jgi:ParB-like chromosome segregation protein Spo0J
MMIDTIEQVYDYQRIAQPVLVTGKHGRQVLVPCANTILVRRDLVVANTYNPNHVSDDKMELLYQSILDNGFAFPIVAIWDDDQQLFVVVDGFHRYMVSGPKWLEMSHVPVAVLQHDAKQRMVATWQFNKARGAHEVDLDADLIRALIQQGMSDEDICQHLGIDLDTVHRYKQLTGIAELFLTANYSMAWEMVEVSGDAHDD